MNAFKKKRGSSEAFFFKTDKNYSIDFYKADHLLLNLLRYADRL